LLASISPRQSEKIDKSFRSNINKFIGSDEFEAMQNDIRMFGDAAFTRSHSSKGGES
jgi:ketosteroid isomerase-like protein